MTDYGPGSSNGEPVNLPAPYDKMEPPAVVRRPEKSGTWQELWQWRQQQWEGRTRDP
ncbi:unnamed protein product [Staurois parvus]|uniref:Uncharacterized protein n=1 Tax=Staurois parvus TaxID=386267 RepID=A0ABN9HRX8_9NEOB|nr:unnamed protein product [Staurois parvus]